MLRIAFLSKAGDARQNITFAPLAFPIAIHVDRAHGAGPATFPFSLMLAAMLKNALVTTIVITIIGIVALTIDMSGLLMWSKYDCRIDYIDIHSGKIKVEKWHLFQMTSESIRETVMSKSIAEIPGGPNWKRVNCFSPGVHHSPHYEYHGAINQVNEIEMARNIYQINNDELINVCTKIRDSWIKYNGYRQAGLIVEEYMKAKYDTNNGSEAANQSLKGRM